MAWCPYRRPTIVTCCHFQGHKRGPCARYDGPACPTSTWRSWTFVCTISSKWPCQGSSHGGQFSLSVLLISWGKKGRRWSKMKGPLPDSFPGHEQDCAETCQIEFASIQISWFIGGFGASKVYHLPGFLGSEGWGLVGWLVGGWVGRWVGGWVGWMVGWLVGWLVGCFLTGLRCLGLWGTKSFEESPSWQCFSTTALGAGAGQLATKLLFLCFLVKIFCFCSRP